VQQYQTRWLGRWVCALSLAGTAVGCLILAAMAMAQVSMSPVHSAHLQRIRELLRANGLIRAEVALDNRGRVELQGAYENEPEVDRAFSLAQTVVGVRWVSPVTPERIRVRAWMSCLENLFAGRQCDRPAGRNEPSETSSDVPPGPPREKYALIVGVGRFHDPTIQSLKYSAKDAGDVYRYMVSPSGGNFPAAAVVLLDDASATRPAVVAALDRIKAKAGPDDLVFVYLSSHGTPPDKFGGVHLVTYDAVVKPREQVWQTSLSEDILRSFIQGVRAKRLIIVLDACYSNGAYARVPGFLPQGGKSLESDEQEGYGQSRLYMAQRLLGMKDLVSEASAGPASPGAVRGGWGKVLISASDAGERSWESDVLKNSIFTHYFLDGLVRTRGSVKAAFEYSRPLVRQQVQREKGHDTMQTPQVTPSRPEWDISVTPKG
jgi:Caspase domain